MIELLYAPSPNGWKISIMLEECGLAYRLRPVQLDRGEQFSAGFLALSPNNKMPAIIDHDPPGGGDPVSVFESAAILIYLAEKSGRFLPPSLRERIAVLEWLAWQISGLGPTLGQHGHFLLYAKEPVPYARQRFREEAERLYGVLDRQLAKTGAYVAGTDYTIADMACFPWIMTHKAQQFSLEDYPNVKRWYAALRAREKVQAGLVAGREFFGDRMRVRSDAERGHQQAQQQQQ
jgi:GSH-dependent disulfide-bond oxidoreductase